MRYKLTAKFLRILEEQGGPRMRQPYLNYLQHYQRRHPRYGFKRVFREATHKWSRLTPARRKTFTKKILIRKRKAPTRCRPRTTRRQRRLRARNSRGRRNTRAQMRRTRRLMKKLLKKPRKRLPEIIFVQFRSNR